MASKTEELPVLGSLQLEGASLSRPGSGFLIDASNLHMGGGVQVGASVVNEVAALARVGGSGESSFNRLTCLVSTEVASNLETATWTSGPDIQMANSYPRKWVDFPDTGYESIFTIFGPVYRRRRANREIAGFARPLMIYPRAEVRLPPASATERGLDWIRWLRFQAADVLVTETQDSARRVAERLPKAEVHVVPNCVSRGISDRASWHRITSLDSLDPDALTLASVGRDYPHKNLDLLGRLGPELERRTGRQVRFVVTLSSEEWARKPGPFTSFCSNVGVLRQSELGPLYEACDATVFPSLLEISSATPLESLYLGLPLFVSDIDSMRATYGRAARYFDPWDPIAAAEALAPELDSQNLRCREQESRDWAGAQGDPMSRASAYLRILWGG